MLCFKRRSIHVLVVVVVKIYVEPNETFDRLSYLRVVRANL
jgi:hypothetical protein